MEPGVAPSRRTLPPARPRPSTSAPTGGRNRGRGRSRWHRASVRRTTAYVSVDVLGSKKGSIFMGISLSSVACVVPAATESSCCSTMYAGVVARRHGSAIPDVDEAPRPGCGLRLARASHWLRPRPDAPREGVVARRLQDDECRARECDRNHDADERRRSAGVASPERAHAGLGREAGRRHSAPAQTWGPRRSKIRTSAKSTGSRRAQLKRKLLRNDHRSRSRSNVTSAVPTTVPS